MFFPPPRLNLAAARSEKRDDARWLDDLPPAWRDMVVAPISFTVHREYELAASRTFGYDAYDLRCFYHHSYVLTETRSDNAEDFYTVVTRGETLRAWRLRDDRWLTWRRTVCGSDGTVSRGFYSFSPTCPV